MTDHAGNRWLKCDLHLHTMTSRCYPEKENTPQEWVAQALRQGLNAVAVTDHNDYRGIAAIMEEGKKQGLSVFPGVEITCDTSKIHILVLFDTDKKAENVQDFLNRCDIDCDHVGDPDGTSFGVFEVCEIAKKRGAMVIAAHIDEFNSINSMNTANLEKLLTGDYLDAVQVSNVPVWRKFKEDKDAEAMQTALREKYGKDATPQEVDRWRKCYNRAEALGIPMLSFSDNPASPTESKHGLFGIGSVYTWIQMDDVINLESIRQSLFTADSRIRMIFDSKEMPKTEPDFWIRSVEVRKSTLNPHAPIHFDFHPQLNCIIGGKGSGKSAIVRVMLGVSRQLSKTLLANTLAEQTRFYSRENEEEEGIFLEDSEIEIIFDLHGSRYRVLVTDIVDMDHQKYAFFRWDPETKEETPVLQEQILLLAFLRLQVFVQKQIAEITITPGALLDFVDRSIDGLYLEKARKNYYLEQLLNLSDSLHSLDRFLQTESRAQMEQEWFGELEQDTKVSQGLRMDFLEGQKKRSDALHQLEACKEERSVMKRQQENLLLQYEECLKEIRRLRTEFIDRVFANEDIYKMELVPLSDRDSFYAMQKEIIAGDEAVKKKDVKKLENALFSDKNGLQKYQQLLWDIRMKSSRQENEKEDFSAYFTHLIQSLPERKFEQLLSFHPEDELRMFYRPNGSKRYFPLATASSGEKATAIISFILSSRKTPLIVDQPEDDIDNRVIYEELVPKIKKIKQERQLIIVTHNANITVNSDPEMMIVMDSHSKFLRARLKGSVDNNEIRNEICAITEGTQEGFSERVRKYHL